MQMETLVLVIESSEAQSRYIKDSINRELGLTCLVAKDLGKLKQILTMHQSGESFIAVSNLVLPDAPSGEAVEYCRKRGIPTLILTSTFDPEVRTHILAKDVVDYVIKTGDAIPQITTLIQRMIKNRGIGVLICDDSLVFRKEQRRLLELLQFKVYEANDGVQGLAMVELHKDIKLVLTDLQMPNMDGMALTVELRRQYSKKELAIIGLSATGDAHTAARFIKSGANDFLPKPFIQEEFNLRVMQNVEILQQIAELYKMAHCDFLTDLFNRRHFFGKAQEILNKKANSAQISLAMFDIDHFKRVNDTYGHDTGDQVLKVFARILDEVCSPHGLVARLGGEEFSVLFSDLASAHARPILEKFRQQIESTPVNYEGQEINMTVSIGLASGPQDKLDTFLADADQNLYVAKETGRNRVVG